MVDSGPFQPHEQERRLWRRTAMGTVPMTWFCVNAKLAAWAIRAVPGVGEMGTVPLTSFS